MIEDQSAQIADVTAPRAVRGTGVHAGESGTVYVLQHGDMHIRDGHPVYRVEPFPLHPRPLGFGDARRQPSRLLAAESRVVAFIGRQRELAELARWRDRSASGPSLMLVHGPGGQGKSRLAAQLAVVSARSGWTVWAAHHVSDPTATLIVAPGDTGAQLLVVVEYADRWPIDDLLLLLSNPLLRRPRRARVLLVSRAADPWWASARQRLGEADIEVGGSMLLTTGAEGADQRRDMFAAARDQFAALLGVTVGTLPAPAGLDGSGFELVLTVHMAALAAVDAHARGGAAPEDPVGLSAYLLDREHDYWQSLYNHDQRMRTPPAMMARTVYTATLARLLRRALAADVLRRAGIAATAEHAERTLADHAVCYPPPDADTALMPLYPDRLGEDFLALLTPGHNVADYTADAWATNAPHRMLLHQASRDSVVVWARPALATLVEAARRWPHVTQLQLRALLRQRPQLALAAGGATLARLAELPDLDIKTLEAVEACFPAQRHVDLDVGIAAVIDRLARHRLAQTSDDNVHARIRIDLGIRMANAGLHQGAYTSTEEAVRIRRKLAGADAGHEPGLATALANLSVILTELGRHHEALTATEESVEIRRRLAAADPFAHEADLAGSLNNLAADLIRMGRSREAHAAMENAVHVYSRLAETGAATYDPDLAMALNNLGGTLSTLGRPEEALAATEHAVQVYRRLAKADPDAYEPDVAMTLNNLSSDLSRLGHHDRALAAAVEAVDARRRLAKVNPAAFQPDLATALTNLAALQSNLGRHRDALTSAQEAVDLYRQLSDANPESHQAELASGLGNLAITLSELDLQPEALTAAREQVTIRRQLAATNPVASEPELARALSNLAAWLSEAGDHQAGVAAVHEALTIYRARAAANPDEFEPDLATTTGNLGLILSALGRRDDAIAATRRALGLLRQLAAAHPGAYDADVAMALNNLAIDLSELGRTVEAVAATREAVGIMRRLVVAQPGAYEERLAMMLDNLASDLAQLGRDDEASAAAGEAAAVQQCVRAQRT